MKVESLPLAVLALCLAAACSSSSSDPSAPGEDAGAPAAAAGIEPKGDGTPAEGLTRPEDKPERQQPSTQPQVKKPGSPSPTGMEPNRFDPGGEISDAQLGGYYVSMNCAINGEDIGTMTFDLWTEEAPITTRNFLRLCDVGFYDGLGFHRILRDFMAQGGDPTGTGTGNSPYGKIKAEFSSDPDREHHYGVLSMARFGGQPDSASSQFFLCCAETPPVWNLDGQYSSFARMTSGVETLEKIRNVPTKMGRGEKSVPLSKVTITQAKVLDGAAPTGEVIEPPPVVLDLGGEPERVTVQRVVVAFRGSRGADRDLTRTKEQAQELAEAIKEQVQAGAVMDQFVASASIDPVTEGDSTPGYFVLMNRGVRDTDAERTMLVLNRAAGARIDGLRDKLRSGELTQAQAMEEQGKIQAEFRAQMPDMMPMPREQLEPAFCDAVFTMEVGEVTVVPYNARNAPSGYYVVRRVE